MSRLIRVFAVILAMLFCVSGQAGSGPLPGANRDPSCQYVFATITPCPSRPTVLVQTAGNPSSGWKLVRAPQSERAGGIAIMKTADTMRSDPDFAGLMVRCGDKGKVDVLVVLVSPISPRSQPQVTIGAGPSAQIFEGKMTAGGAAVLLPEAAAGLAAGPWQIAASLTITVKDNDSEIKGIVALDGLRPAYGNLLSSCMQ